MPLDEEEGGAWTWKVLELLAQPPPDDTPDS